MLIRHTTLIRCTQRQFRLLFRSIAAVLLVSVSVGSMANDGCPLLDIPYVATYHGSYKGWRLDATQSLVTESTGLHQFTLLAENPIGRIKQTSEFTLDPSGQLRSNAYHYLRHLVFRTETLDTRFDWTQLTATTLQPEKKPRLASLQGGELDNLSYQLALRCDLHAGHTDFQYRLVDGRVIEPVTFRVIGQELLATELGVLDTVIVKRIRDNNNRTTTFWFARDLDYLMVKLLQEELKDTEAYLLYIDRYSRSKP